MLINLAGRLKNFHNLDLKGMLRSMSWAGGGKLGGQNYRFEIGALKLFNNATTFPLILKCNI
jgi:hypothetical protein